MSEVKLPGVGGVSKKALVIGGVASAAVIGLVLLRKRSAASAPAATAGTDPNAIDPATGLTYAEEAAGASTSDYLSPGLQDTTGGPTYGATGYYDPNTGQWVYGNTGTGQAAAVTNQQWAQNAISYLGQNGGVDTGALAQALGAYLNGQAVTSAQESLIDQAIAVEGYPPVSGANGYPPGIRTSDTGSGAGGTAGSGGGVTGSGGSTEPPGTGAGTGTTGTSSGGSPKAAGAISNLRATKVTKSGFTVQWNKATGATQGYEIIVSQLNGAIVKRVPRQTGTSLAVANLHPGWTYNVGVQALPGGPGNNIHVALPSK
jgi:hypothetical protein